jgi:hypothetical protein
MNKRQAIGYVFAGCCAILLVVLPAAGEAKAEPIAYGPMQVVGQLDDPRIKESSGLDASQVSLDQLWTHNDSGGQAKLYRFKTTGEVTATIRLDIPRPRDWEDMASFTWRDRPWLLVADVGDNDANRPSITLWLLPEQDWSGNREFEKLAAIQIDLAYADGPRDCESVAVDPVRGEILLISKIDPRRNFTDQSAAYIVDLKQVLMHVQASKGKLAEAYVVERAATLPLKITTAADISADGRRLVVATYGDAFLFSREEEESWIDALAREPQQIALGPRGQSEAIAFGSDDQTLYLTSEKVGRPIWAVSPE